MSVSARPIEVRFHWTSETHGISSVDFSPTQPRRFLTAGLEGTVKVWELDVSLAEQFFECSEVIGMLTQFCSYVATLFREGESGGACNTARWSPFGKLIAAGYDSKSVILWQRVSQPHQQRSDDDSVEPWTVYRTLMGHTSEVLDVAFSRDSRQVISGCQDMVIIHDVFTGAVQQCFPQNYTRCQGVSFDPWCRFATAFFTNHVFTVYARKTPQTEFRVAHNFGRSKDLLLKGDEASLFFRRHSWSPDGTLLAVPCGWSAEDSVKNCTYIFTRKDLSKPILSLGFETTDNVSIIGAKFSPSMFDPVKSESYDAECYGAWGPKDYVMAIALWTVDSLVVFTTAAACRYASFANATLRMITDVAWLNSGHYLAISSLDGYVTLANLQGNLGAPIEISSRVSNPLFALLHGVCEKFSGQAAENEQRTVTYDKSAVATVAAVRRKKSKIEDSDDEAPAVELPVADVETLGSCLD